jgi:hypothetical protein
LLRSTQTACRLTEGENGERLVAGVRFEAALGFLRRRGFFDGGGEPDLIAPHHGCGVAATGQRRLPGDVARLAPRFGQAGGIAWPWAEGPAPFGPVAGVGDGGRNKKREEDAGDHEREKNVAGGGELSFTANHHAHAFFLFLAATLHAQTPALEQLIEVRTGTLPVILTVPHGGTLKPDNVLARRYGVTGMDANTIPLSEMIIEEMEARYGGKPHAIISRLHRSKLDPTARSKRRRRASRRRRRRGIAFMMVPRKPAKR